MVNKNIKVPQVPKYEEIKELKESNEERLIQENYEIEFDSYNSIGVSRGYIGAAAGTIGGVASWLGRKYFE